MAISVRQLAVGAPGPWCWTSLNLDVKRYPAIRLSDPDPPNGPAPCGTAHNPSHSAHSAESRHPGGGGAATERLHRCKVVGALTPLPGGEGCAPRRAGARRVHHIGPGRGVLPSRRHHRPAPASNAAPASTSNVPTAPARSTASRLPPPTGPPGRGGCCGTSGSAARAREILAGFHGHVRARLGTAPGPLRQLPHGRQVCLVGAGRLGESDDRPPGREQPPAQIPLPRRPAVARAVGHHGDAQPPAVDEPAQLVERTPSPADRVRPTAPSNEASLPLAWIRYVIPCSVPNYPGACANAGLPFLNTGRTGAFGSTRASPRAPGRR